MLTDTSLGSEFSAQIIESQNNFSLLHEAMYRCKDTHDSPYHLTKLAIHSFLRPEAVSRSKYGQISYEMVYFDDIVHFIDEDNNVTFVDFDCGFTFHTEAATKVGQINQKRKNICRLCEK